MTKFRLRLPISELAANFGFSDLHAGHDVLWMMTWSQSFDLLIYNYNAGIVTG
jgi:hypothetical protein